MPRVIDTTADFDTFVEKAALESPLVRKTLWEEIYERPNAEVFEAFYTAQGSRERPIALLRDLARVRRKSRDGRATLPEVIEKVDPAVRDALKLPASPEPVHVLLVGTGASNAVVGRLGDDVAVFHCLEWFQSSATAKVPVAHEVTHAWHEIALGVAPPREDIAWLAFSEGLAIEVSRTVVPDQLETDYYWYGLPGFDAWTAWCQDNRELLMERFRTDFASDGAADTFFGAGLVEGRTRTGYFIARELVAGMGRGLDELASLSPDAAVATVRDAVGVPAA